MKKLPTIGVLSVVDGRLMGDIGTVYEVVSFLIGRAAFTHELSYYGKASQGVLGEHFPIMSNQEGKDYKLLTDEAISVFGNTVEVPDDLAGCLRDDNCMIDTLNLMLNKKHK